MFKILNAIQIADYRVLNDQNELPKKLIREWKTLFLSGKPLYKNYDLDLEKDKIHLIETEENVQDLPIEEAHNNNIITPIPLDATLSGISLLDDNEFNDYIRGVGQWTYQNERFLFCDILLFLNLNFAFKIESVATNRISLTTY